MDKTDIEAAIKAGLSPERGDWREYLDEAKKIVEKKSWSAPRQGTPSNGVQVK
jgi:hypothetical protein